MADNSSVDYTGDVITPPTNRDLDLNPSNAVAEQLVHALKLYVPFVVVTVGVIGNILSLIVMTRPHFRQTTSSVYLCALAIGDSCYLLFFPLQRALLSWGLRAIINKSADLHTYCAFYHFSTYATKLFGMYIIIVMTYDRMLSVCLPLKTKQWSTRRNAKITVFIVLIISVLESSPRLAVQASEEFKNFVCPYFFPIEFAINYINYYNIHSTVCGSLVLIANTIIITSLIRSNRQRKRLSSMFRDQRKTKKGTYSNRQISIMLSVVSFFYVLALVPAQFHFQFWPNASDELRAQIGWRKFSLEVLLFFEALNYGINFWLYVFSCAKFRQVVMDLFRPGVRAGALRPAVHYQSSHSHNTDQEIKTQQPTVAHIA